VGEVTAGTWMDGTDKDVDGLGLRLRSETERVGELDERGEPSDERLVLVRGEDGRFSTGTPCTYASSALSMAGNDHLSDGEV